MIEKIELPCYCDSLVQNPWPEHTVIVRQFAGNLQLSIITKDRDKETVVTVALDFDDLLRAWNAVKRF